MSATCDGVSETGGRVSRRSGWAGVPLGTPEPGCGTGSPGKAGVGVGVTPVAADGRLAAPDGVEGLPVLVEAALLLPPTLIGELLALLAAALLAAAAAGVLTVPWANA